MTENNTLKEVLFDLETTFNFLSVLKMFVHLWPTH